MWEPFLWLALVVMGWRWLKARRARGWSIGSLPNVGDAPTDAEPLLRPRLDDNGLATYSMVLPGDRPAPARSPAPLPSVVLDGRPVGQPVPRRG